MAGVHVGGDSGGDGELQPGARTGVGAVRDGKSAGRGVETAVLVTLNNDQQAVQGNRSMEYWDCRLSKSNWRLYLQTSCFRTFLEVSVILRPARLFCNALSWLDGAAGGYTC